ncbi:MAG TPA: hypothetical protein VHW23_25400 [Kofleriaceae bacterium]|nr:hypothetical protein [Kofleriaceae bacterium]
MSKRISTTATIEKIDTEKRDLTVRDDAGNQFTVRAPNSVKLDQLHEGDRLKIDYYEALAVSLKRGAAGAPARGESSVTEHTAGTMPGGVVAHRITGTVDVINVDRARNRLIVRRPDGATDSINVTDPAMQAELANVHPGDRIQATYTEAAAIKVMRAGPGQGTGQGPSQGKEQGQGMPPGSTPGANQGTGQGTNQGTGQGTNQGSSE